MGGINQIINIYSNINRMTDQQKGYGLGIILGIRLPCPRGERAAAGGPQRTARGRRLRRARSRTLSLSAYHLYIHTTR